MRGRVSHLLDQAWHLAADAALVEDELTCDQRGAERAKVAAEQATVGGEHRTADVIRRQRSYDLTGCGEHRVPSARQLARIRRPVLEGETVQFGRRISVGAGGRFQDRRRAEPRILATGRPRA